MKSNLKKFLMITCLFTTTSVFAGGQSLDYAYYLTKELCSEYYADCIDQIGQQQSGTWGTSTCNIALTTCVNTGDWIPPGSSSSLFDRIKAVF